MRAAANFDDDRRRAQSIEERWRGVYPKLFGAVKAISAVTKGWRDQSGGVDRRITLVSGQELRIEEKSDWYEPKNFFLEYWSDVDRGALGWIEKPLGCHFLVYSFVNLKPWRVYRIPWAPLRQAWDIYGDLWIWEYGEKRRDNERNGRKWTTVGVAVPIHVVLNAVKNIAVVEVDV